MKKLRHYNTNFDFMRPYTKGGRFSTGQPTRKTGSRVAKNRTRDTVFFTACYGLHLRLARYQVERFFKV